MKELKITCQQQLENLQQEFDEFAYIVSHDLKGPLRAISNLSGWISEDLGEDLDQDIKHNIELLQNRTERLERMINALLIYSRIARFEMDLKEVNVRELVQGIAAGLQKDKPFTLTVTDLPVLNTYVKKLETVFTHLLQNAVRFNDHAQPQVWVEAQRQKEFVIFTVRDNGIGISEDALEKIFKIFYTVQPKDHQENLGVGLSVTKKILQVIGGTIAVQSEKDKGTVVTVTWPLLPPNGKPSKNKL
ncbi:sensor histidine kinase [Rufibacter radiotolerans]|uniref:sensor histidine kinase n=1 Tax=Rufibacter radiotolerans TaxID=1379910 RepID=UPI000664620E|nr:HAMP domain-containing sensor histidine kinase [Rufibacter radiotolerans]